MTKLFIFLFVFLSIDLPDVNRIAKINQLKEEAAVAYKKKMYQVAINRYKTLLKDLGVEDEKVKLNLAHAYYLSQDTTNARKEYGELTTAKDKYVRSLAQQQMGNMRAKANDLESALLHYKAALKAYPENEEARQNYELVKKLLKKQQQQKKQNPENQNDKKQQEQKEKEKKEQNEKQDKQQQNKQNQEKQNQEKQNQEKQNQEKQQEKEQQEKQQQQNKQKESEGGEKKDKQGDKKQAERDDNSDKTAKEKEKERSQLRSQRLQGMNMSNEQAKNILDAMKSSEVQYLQQNQKRTNKKPEKGKPDW
jgi:Ca-activated chloride channel family protein